MQLTMYDCKTLYLIHLQRPRPRQQYTSRRVTANDAILYREAVANAINRVQEALTNEAKRG